jgi:hypothetical protein
MNRHTVMSGVTPEICPDLVDRLISAYCEWREECREVAAAYQRFLNAEPPDVPLAHAAYVAALDREESASRAYASHVERVTAIVGTASDSYQRRYSRENAR